MTRPAATPVAPIALTPPTQALLAALHAIQPNFYRTTGKKALAEAVRAVFHHVAASAFRQSRYRNAGNYCRVASEYTNAVILGTRWADQLAAVPPNPHSAEADPDLHAALVAALAERIVVDGMDVAAQAMVTCRKAVQAATGAGAPAHAS